MATYMLVHGGGHGGWCYWKVAPLLRAAGHDVYAPTLTGLGERRHLMTPDTDLETHIADVVNTLVYEDLTDVILVGHSYGGMVITGVADRAADRLKELVYLDAGHPKNGESNHDLAPGPIGETHKGMWVENGAELVMKPQPGFAAFFGITDPTDAAFTDARLTPHPWKAFAQKLDLKNGDTAFRVPRTNINCTQSLAGSNPEARARQLDGRNFEIDTGHDLMITEPRRVADILLSIA